MILTGHADDPEVLAVHGAVESALAKVFGDQVPLALKRTPPGPLALVRVYWVEAERGPFFHYVGWGLTEMGAKVSDSPATSGFGIELSAKVQAFPEERVMEAPRARLAPLWPVDLLTRLAAAVQRSGNPYGDQHWIQAGPQGFGPENVRHLGCLFDNAFEPVDTPNGSFRFLQIYTLDDAELEQCKEADRTRTTAPVHAERRSRDPNRVITRSPTHRGGNTP